MPGAPGASHLGTPESTNLNSSSEKTETFHHVWGSAPDSRTQDCDTAKRPVRKFKSLKTSLGG